MITRIVAKNDVYEPLTEERYQEILREGREAVLQFPVSSAAYDSHNDKLIFNMKNGSVREINLYDVEELRTATKEDLKGIYFSFSGIHVEKLDVDISIEGLLKDKGLI